MRWPECMTAGTEDLGGDRVIRNAQSVTVTPNPLGTGQLQRLSRNLFLLGFWLTTFLTSAAVPECKTEVTGGVTIETCTRRDATCLSVLMKFVEEKNEQWKENWTGCAWPAIIIKSPLPAPLQGKGHFFALTLVASYMDSERMDLVLKVELPDHTFKEYIRKDIPIVGDPDRKLHSADILIGTNELSIGVPTIELIEKGGRRPFSHSYK